MRRVLALMLFAVTAITGVAHAEPGQSTPSTRPSVQLETAMPDDDDTVVRPAPPQTHPTASPSPSPSPSPKTQRTP